MPNGENACRATSAWSTWTWQLAAFLTNELRRVLRIGRTIANDRNINVARPLRPVNSDAAAKATEAEFNAANRELCDAHPN